MDVGWGVSYLCRCTKDLRGWCLPCSRQNFLERVGLEHGGGGQTRGQQDLGLHRGVMDVSGARGASGHRGQAGPAGSGRPCRDVAGLRVCAGGGCWVTLCCRSL